MSNPFALFRIKREERWLFVVALMVFGALNGLLISSHWDMYTKPLLHGGAWSVFTSRFTMSGYDCWSWLTITEGRVDFQTIRHPLYLTFLYPMFWLNRWLMDAVGINFATLMMGLIITLCAAYAAVLFFRICREVLALSLSDSLLLTVLLFSFAHVLVPCMVPDHFAITLFLLMITLYIAGKCLMQHRALKPWQGFVLAFFSGGMAASNVVKAYLAGLFANGKRFFRPRYLLIAVVLPAVLLLGIQQCQSYTIERPLAEKNAKVIKANAFKIDKKRQAAHAQWMAENNMRHFTTDKSSILYLFDFTTPRLPTLASNYFGEGFQLHEDHALEDATQSRPQFVGYHFWGNDAVEVLIVLLLALGMGFGCRHRFYLLALSWFGFDFLLNIVLGFAINEPYIMTSGWAAVIPIGLGYALKRLRGNGRSALRATVLFLSLFLLTWNLRIIIGHLL